MRESASGSTARYSPRAPIPRPMPEIPAGLPSGPLGALHSWRPPSPGDAVGQELELGPRRISRLGPNWCPVPFSRPARLPADGNPRGRIGGRGPSRGRARGIGSPISGWYPRSVRASVGTGAWHRSAVRLSCRSPRGTRVAEWARLLAR